MMIKTSDDELATGSFRSVGTGVVLLVVLDGVFVDTAVVLIVVVGVV